MGKWITLYDALIESTSGLAEAVGFLSMAITLHAPKDEYIEIYKKELASLREKQEKVKSLIHQWEVERKENAPSNDGD